MNSWIKEANDTVSKTTFIQGKKNAKDRLWKLIIVAEEPEDITAVDNEMYNDMSAKVRESEKKSLRKVSVSFAWSLHEVRLIVGMSQSVTEDDGRTFVRNSDRNWILIKQ